MSGNSNTAVKIVGALGIFMVSFIIVGGIIVLTNHPVPQELVFRKWLYISVLGIIGIIGILFIGWISELFSYLHSKCEIRAWLT